MAPEEEGVVNNFVRKGAGENRIKTMDDKQEAIAKLMKKVVKR
jgi:hypothetical protein